MTNISQKWEETSPYNDGIIDILWKNFPISAFWYLLELFAVIILIVLFKFRILRTPRGSIYLMPSKISSQPNSLDNSSKYSNTNNASETKSNRST